MSSSTREERIEQAARALVEVCQGIVVNPVKGSYQYRLNALRAALAAPPDPAPAPVRWCGDAGEECQECGYRCHPGEARKSYCPKCGWTDDQQAAFEGRHRPAPESTWHPTKGEDYRPKPAPVDPPRGDK
jgi:hypothetical protein